MKRFAVRDLKERTEGREGRKERGLRDLGGPLFNLPLFE